MANVEIICSLCGEKSKSESAPASCPICSASLEVPQKETVLKTTVCITSSSGAGVAAQKGTLFLTNQRIFWLRHSSKFHRGIIQGLLQKLFSVPKEMQFSYPLHEIAAIEIAQVGPFKSLKLTMTNGETIALDIKAKHRQEWIDAVNDAKKRLAL